MSDHEDFPADFSDAFDEAVSSGNVELALSDKEEDLLVDNWGTRLTLVRETRMSPELFGLCLSDEGGFSSILMDEADWAKMKSKIDAFLEHRNKSGGKQ